MTAEFASLRNLELKVAGLIVGVMVIISVIIGYMLNTWIFRRLDNMRCSDARGRWRIRLRDPEIGG
jgi:hypothetical protein